MQASSSVSRVLHWLLLASLSISPVVLAKSTASMDVDPGTYKIKSGSTLPIKGPIVEVYAQGASATYSHVANTHKTYPVLVSYTATCSNKGRLSGGSIVVSRAKSLLSGAGMAEPKTVEKGIDIGDGFSSESIWVNVPYDLISGIKPADHCNEHAKTLSLEKQQPLEKIVQKGFTMKIPNVLSAKGSAFCSAAGIGKGDAAGDSTDNLSVYLHCVANPKARTGKQTTKTSKPKRPDAGKATTIFKAATFKTDKPKITADCPVGMKFNGTITASGKGEIQYQIIGDRDHEAPLKTLQFDKAGTQEFHWTRMMRQDKPEAKFAVAGQPSEPNKISGWMQLKVIYKVSNKMAFTKKTWLSKRQNYEVNCGKAPARYSK